jgi:hypothetical protein
VLIIVVAGAIAMIGQRLPWFKIGKLPGDIVFENGKSRIFIPITSVIVVGTLLALAFGLVKLFVR